MSAIGVTITGLEELRRRTNPALLLAAIQRHVQQWEFQFVNYIVANKLQGAPLHHRSGRLANSVLASGTRPVQVTGDKISVEVGAGSDAFYGRIHEYGGSFFVPEFNRVSKDKFSIVHSHSVTFPERSWLRTSAKERQLSFKEAVTAGAREALIGA